MRGQGDPINMNKFLALAITALFSISAAQGELLHGGIEKSNTIPTLNLQALEPSLDPAAAEFGQKCVCFNSSRVEAKQIDGRWQIIDGPRWLLDFGTRGDAVQDAVKAIKFYGLNQICAVGALSQYNTPNFHYFLVDGKAPRGPMPGDDTIAFDNSLIKAENVQGRWKITEGDNWMLDFNQDEASARATEKLIKLYAFNRQCFIGRPGSPMMYFRAD
jgi:hypothetical protein